MKRLLNGRVVLLSIVLMMITCMGAPMEAQAASKPGQVKKISIKNNCKSVKISWKKVKGAKGYQVYRATSKKGKYKKVKTTKGTVYTDGKVNSGKRYYYKVRAYAGSRKGKYSAVKSVVVKSHSWKKVAEKGHYETSYVQVPFSQAVAPWDQTYNIYRCLCSECQAYKMNYGMQEALMMKHMNEVNSPGWAEEVYEGHDFCNNCGIDLTANGLPVSHTMDCGPKGWTNKYTLVRTVEHRATAKKVWIQDSKAYTYCTRCKTRK